VGPVETFWLKSHSEIIVKIGQTISLRNWSLQSCCSRAQNIMVPVSSKSVNKTLEVYDLPRKRNPG